MASITVVNRDVYGGPGILITRKGGIFGNVFVIGKDGDREQVIKKYRAWLWDVLQGQSDLQRAVFDLARRYAAGEDLILICCCEPLPCHGHVLRRAIMWVARTYFHFEGTESCRT